MITIRINRMRYNIRNHTITHYFMKAFGRFEIITSLNSVITGFLSSGRLLIYSSGVVALDCIKKYNHLNIPTDLKKLY
jgi:hypothetical protein